MYAFLPISYERNRPEADHGDELHEKSTQSKKPDRKEFLEDLQESKELSLKRTADVAI